MTEYTEMARNRIRQITDGKSGNRQKQEHTSEKEQKPIEPADEGGYTDETERVSRLGKKRIT